ncbi:MAG TPA: hypothetical protein VFS21_33770 [Roseiflexaceae bacterium]|nr:hypothetical protein [Roseiflexaceae bacterium]
MSDTDDKLTRGFTLLARSGGDPDLLGVALLAIHGALEEHLRAELLARPDLRSEERQTLEHYSAGWLPLVRLAQQYLDLTHDQRRTIQEASLLRQNFAYGEPFGGSVGTLLHYGRLVEKLCERRGLLNEILLDRRRELQAQAAAAAAAASENATDDPAPNAERPPAPQPATAPAPPARRATPAAGQAVAARPVVVPPPKPTPPQADEEDSIDDFADHDPDAEPRPYPWVLTVATVVLVIALCLVMREIAVRMDLGALIGSLGAPAPAAVATETTPGVPETTPVLQARLVGIGAGPGWLHDAPSFDSATLPVPLNDGMVVRVLDQQETSADGVVWQYVTIGGYEGWCPLANLEFAP